MRSPPTIDERLARIEGRMATRDDVDALRASVERRGPGWPRWAAGALFGAALTLGFLALAVAFTR